MKFSFWRRNLQQEQLDVEIQTHLEMAARDRVDRGESPAQAEASARREFGNVALVKEVTRSQWDWLWLEEIWQDLRYGARTLRKNPGFTAIAVLTLALGIGANTSLFSVVNGVLLNPPPYPHPEQLVAVHESKANFDTGSISYPNFRDWQRENRSFSSIAITRGFGMNVTGLGEAEQLRVRFISSDFFPLLGVKAVAGRVFVDGEDEIGRAPIALISAGLWKRKFGEAPDIVGKSVRLDGKDYTIVGVIPADFDLLTESFRPASVYLPIGQWNHPGLTVRAAGLGIHGFGRLRRGVTIEQAREDMERITRNLAEAYPDADTGIGATLIPLKKEMVGDVQPMLLVLLAAVCFVLLIACVNVANLLLARSTARGREFAIRAALGAGRSRILRQLITESTLLALAGGGIGVLLAGWCTKIALRQLAENLPRARGIAIDTHVLLFTLCISVLCGALFGLAPALKSSLPNLQSTLKEGGRGGTGRHQRAQSMFVAAEMAMALVLLIASGLLVRSLVALWSVDPGFDPHHVLTCGVSLAPSIASASATSIRVGFRDVVREVRAVRGVQAVSLSWAAVPMAMEDDDQFWLEGQPKPASESDMNWVLSYIVQEDYLKVMGIPLERGRFFMAQDNENSPTVVVVDDVFAKKFFDNQDPIGKRIHLNNEGVAAEIVGIVGHVKQWGLDLDDANPLRAQLYYPFMQLSDSAVKLSWNGTALMVRFEGTAEGITGAIRNEITAMNGEQVMFDVQTMDEIVDQTLAPRRLSVILLGAFAGLALLLASVGIYGVISYLVGQRTHEIGIRMALGAHRIDVLGLVLRQGAKMAFIGIGIGLLASFGLTRLMANMIYGVSPTDPLTFLGVATILMLVALAACYIPARRAMHVDPIVALRYP
jgi:predicted permease